MSAYQVLAEQGNVAAEKMLNLVHTTESMQRAKDAITSMPSTTGDDIDYEAGGFEEFFGDEDDDEGESMNIGGEEGPISRSGMPFWAFSKECDVQHFKTTLIHQIQETHNALQSTTNASTRKLL